MPKRKRKQRGHGAMHPSNSPAPRSERSVASGSANNGWVRMRLTAKLLADAHPGSGSGAQGIDALVARDRRDHPVIWASHVEGVLRDAARRLGGQAVAEDLFGRSGGHPQRAIFTSLYCNSNPGHRIWRSAARASSDENGAFTGNRAPLDDSLRAVEYVPKGTQFQGQVELPVMQLSQLQRLIQETDALGSARAAGAGRVELSLTECAVPTRPVGSATSRLILLLRNLDPLCITATATPDNLIPSLAFVPGRAVLGAIANWLIGEDRRDIANLFVDGRVSVGDALPLPEHPAQLSTAEVLPAPLALYHEKPAGEAGAVPWWARSPQRARQLDVRHAARDSSKLRRPEPDLFVYRRDAREPWIPFRPQRRIRLRNGRPNPTQVEPMLFAIEQIVEHTEFLCELRGEQTEMAQITEAIRPVLESRRWLRMGRAGAPVEVADHEWCDAPALVDVLRQATVTLTSDLLVHDELLRWRTSLDKSCMSAVPGWPSNVRVDWKNSLQEPVAVHGFNGTSRLWRMPASGIRRGSVFLVEGDGVHELARMAAEGRWLGERTNEGFGRFRVDATLPGICEPTALSEDRGTNDEPDESVAATTQSWLQARFALANPSTSLDRKPSLSQWFDLVADLEQNPQTALSSRQNPTTAGGRSWRHPDAREVLNELAKLPQPERAAYARLFVRWLRAEIRRRAK
jgi:hypothetical protein